MKLLLTGCTGFIGRELIPLLIKEGHSLTVISRQSKGKLKKGAEETIYRALALRALELPVGEFITEALDKNVPDLSLIHI